MARFVNRPIDPSFYQLPTALDLAEDVILQRLAAIPEGMFVRKADAIKLFEVHEDRWAVWQRVGIMPHGLKGTMEGGLAQRSWRPPEVAPAPACASGADPSSHLPGPGQDKPRAGGRVKGGATWQCFYEIETLIRTRVAMRRQEEPYPDPHEAGVWRLPVASHSGPKVALIDEIDLPVVKGRRWTLFRLGQDHVWAVMLSSSVAGSAGAHGNVGARADACGDGRAAARGARWIPPLLHRMILGLEDRPDLFVLHHNHDPLDCRRANLFVRTILEKCHANTKRGLRSGRVYSSKYKGVCWSERAGKWVANIGFNGRHRTLGRFDDEEDAARAYDAAARELFTACAALNFPGPGENSALRLAA